jgi:hypothetical protein
MTATITTPEATDAGSATVSLDERVASACGHLNAAWAHLVDLVREVIETATWHGVGIRSVEQWISWRTGLAAHHAHTLVALAGAVEVHPLVCERFAAGELSVDQAALAIKASPEHDGDIAEMATAMTLSQLRVAVRASNVSTAERHASEPNDAHGDDAEQESAPAPRIVSSSRCGPTRTVRGRSMDVSTRIMGRSSTPPSARRGTAASMRVGTTSPGSTPSSTSPDARWRRWTGSVVNGSASTCSWILNTPRQQRGSTGSLCLMRSSGCWVVTGG